MFIPASCSLSILTFHCSIRYPYALSRTYNQSKITAGAAKASKRRLAFRPRHLPWEIHKMRTLLCTLFLLLTSSAMANDSIVRVGCAPSDAGGQVFINGELRGQCPVDIMLPAGEVDLEVILRVDAKHEKRFHQKFVLYAGVAKRVIVAYGPARLTAEARKAMEEAEREQRRLAAEARRKRERTAHETRIAAARKGEVAAMEVVAVDYETGRGTKKDLAKAAFWRKKATTAKAKAAEKARLEAEQALLAADRNAAGSGDPEALRRMGDRYHNGNGVPRNPEEAGRWYARADQAAEKRKRAEALEKRRDAHEAKRREIEARLEKARYFPCMRHEFGKKRTDPFEIFLTGIPSSWIGSTIDTLLLPVTFTQKMCIQKELDAHAAAWANPDSMMGQAFKTPVH